MKKNRYIIISGLSGSGKSTFSKLLKDISGLNVINAGDAIRFFLSQMEIDVPKRELTGDVFLSHYPENKLYNVIFDFALKSDSHIIDGPRLYSTYKGFKENSQIELIMIFIDIYDGLRNERLLNRFHSISMGEDATSVMKVKDSYYENIMMLKGFSEYVISNNGTIENLVVQAQLFWDKINT